MFDISFSLDSYSLWNMWPNICLWCGSSNADVMICLDRKWCKRYTKFVVKEQRRCVDVGRKLEEKTSSVLNLWRGSASLGSVWCHLCLCFSCFIMTLSMWSFCFLYVSKAGKTTRPFSPTEADFPTMTNFFWSGHPTSSCGCGCVWLCL